MLQFHLKLKLTLPVATQVYKNQANIYLNLNRILSLILCLKIRDYSYHRTIWKDMDDDGDLDAVTARFHNSMIDLKLNKCVR